MHINQYQVYKKNTYLVITKHLVLKHPFLVKTGRLQGKGNVTTLRGMYPSLCRVLLSHDSALLAKPKQNTSPCVLILAPKSSPSSHLSLPPL